MHHPYILRPLGHKPDLNRPLRSDPVRRNEVRVYRKFNRGGDPQWLVTMPPGAYRLEERGNYDSQYFVGDRALWQPLMDELVAQYAAEHEYWGRRGLAARSQPRPLPSLEIPFLMGFEYECEHCGARFLAHKLAVNVSASAPTNASASAPPSSSAPGAKQTPARIITVNIIANAINSAPRPAPISTASIAV
jgi:hypothetical protein